jgi:asparaginyl-tRNA synthetase
MAFCNIDCNRKTAEEFIRYLLNFVLSEYSEDMEFFNKWIEKGLIENLQKVIDAPFTHMTYTEAVKELENAKTEWEYKPYWGADLQAEHEKFLTEEIIKGPVIVTGYPKEIKAFYMKQNDDGKTVRAMDVLVPRLGEIIGGSQREDNFDKLENRIREAGMNPDDYSWYLDLRKYGSVPHSGFGLGFERLIQYVTGMQNIRDVIPFPRAPKTIDF